MQERGIIRKLHIQVRHRWNKQVILIKGVEDDKKKEKRTTVKTNTTKIPGTMTPSLKTLSISP